MARYRRMDHDQNPLSPVLDRFETEQLHILHRLCKDKRRGVRPFFGSVKATIALRDYIDERDHYDNFGL